MKKVVKLTESDLHRIVKESIDGLNRAERNHEKEAEKLNQYAVLPHEKYMADEYKRIPEQIYNGLKWLDWLIPDKHDGIQQRVSSKIINAAQVLLSSQDVVMNAVMNAYTQFLYTQHHLETPQIHKYITKGENIEDRFEDYYDRQIGQPEERPEPSDWHELNDKGYFDNLNETISRAICKYLR